VLLYPIYALFQSSRLVGRQLRQTARQASPRLKQAEELLQQTIHPERPPTSPTVDTPIFKTLQTLQAFALPIPVDVTGRAIALPPSATPHASLPAAAEGGALAIGQPSSLSPTHAGEVSVTSTGELVNIPAESIPRLIQGVASLIATQTLVLTTTDNAILDILTAEQQHQLRQRITWELAHYWRYRKALEVTQASPSRVLPPPPERANLWPPVQSFWRLMAWIQRGPVAIATNLFQEAAWLSPTSSPEPESKLTVDYQLPGRRLFPSPKAIKQLFAQRSVVVADYSIWEDWPEPTTVSASASPSSTSKPSTLLGMPLARLLQPVRRVRSLPAASLQPPQALQGESPWQQALQRLPFKPNLPQLFKQSPLAGLVHLRPQTSQPSNFTAVDSPSIDRVQPDTTPDQMMRLAQTSPAINLADTRIDPHFVDPSHSKLLTELPSSNSLSVSSSSQASPVVAEEGRAIDVEATLVDYIKHPLEQILEWLDLGMLWFERKLGQLWAWLRRPWHHKDSD
jgi:hypothetical protein